jgi:Tfp pilus assembly protein PilF
VKSRLADVPLAETLRDHFFDAVDGVLAVTTPTSRSELFLDQGSVFYAKSDAPDQKLERILVRWGLVSEGAIASFVQRAGRDVRGTLVAEGIFPTPQAFDEFMGQILRERVMDCFVLEEGDVELEVRDVRAMRQIPFPATMPNVILEGARRMAGASRILAPLVEDDAPLALNERPAVPLQSLQMGPTEGFVLSLVTGRTSLSEISRVSPLGPDESARLLYGLLVLDVLRHPAFVGVRFNVAHLARRTEVVKQREQAERDTIGREYQRLRSVDLFQLVPGGSKLTGDEIRVAVRGYQEQWSPDKFLPAIAKEMRDELVLIAGRASELLLAAMESERKARAGDFEAAVAAQGMSGDALRLKRLEFSKSEAQEKKEADVNAASQWFRKAQDALAGKDYHDAIQFAREAIRRDERAEFHAVLAESLTMNPHWSKKAEESWMRAIELDPYAATYPLALGRLYAKAGLRQRAREQFEKALALQPENEDAKAALKEVK